MGFLLRLATYAFHPLIIPSLAWMLFMLVQPNQSMSFLFKFSYKEIFLFTLIIPAMIWIYLKLSRRISDWQISKVEQRRLPLILYAACLIALLYIGKLNYIVPLKAFIYGLLCSISISGLVSFLKIKVSLHQLGISAITIFIICLSIYFHIELLSYISISILANGLVASSSLYLKRHTPKEVALGFMLGAIPQLYLVGYWL